jgi:hypothetical protein
MAQIYIDAEVAYSQNAIKSAVETMKLSLPVMGVTARNLSASAMGYLIPERAIQGARKTDWLLIAANCRSAHQRKVRHWRPCAELLEMASPFCGQ